MMWMPSAASIAVRICRLTWAKGKSSNYAANHVMMDTRQPNRTAPLRTLPLPSVDEDMPHRCR